MSGENETETQVANDLHDEAFDEAVKNDGASAGSETTPETEAKPAEEKKSEESPKEEAKKPEESAQKKEEAKPSEEATAENEEIKKLKEAIEETKRWGTDNAAKVAELTKKLEAYEKKPAETPPEEEMPEEVKKLYEDYPEFRAAVDWETNRKLKGMPSVDPQKIDSIEKLLFQSVFEQSITNGFVDKEGVVHEGHPDAIRIAHTKEFQEFAAKDPDQYTADPLRAISLISRFKESKVKQATKEHDTKAREEADERKKTASAPVRSHKGAAKGSDPNDYDRAFDEAAN